MTYLCCACWHVFLQSLCLTSTGPQSKGTGLEGVSCGGGLLTRNVLLLPLHRLSQVCPCYKHEKLYVRQSRLRGLPRILNRSCPCKRCFKPAPGLGGCTGRAALELSWGSWWDPARRKRAVQQGIWAGTWVMGGTGGVMRSWCRGVACGRDSETRRWVWGWKKVGSRSWGIGKGTGGEGRGGDAPAQAMLPARVMLLGWPQGREVGSGGWRNC